MVRRVSVKGVLETKACDREREDCKRKTGKTIYRSIVNREGSRARIHEPRITAFFAVFLILVLLFAYNFRISLELERVHSGGARFCLPGRQSVTTGLAHGGLP